MESKWYKERVAYSDSEISIMIKEKMKNEKVTIDNLYGKYKDTSISITREEIEAMLEEKSFFNLQMLEVASDFLNIDFNKLTEVIIDDDSVDYRSDSDESIEEFSEMINIIFGEMINNIKLNRKVKDLEIY